MGFFVPTPFGVLLTSFTGRHPHALFQEAIELPELRVRCLLERHSAFTIEEHPILVHRLLDLFAHRLHALRVRTQVIDGSADCEA